MSYPIVLGDIAELEQLLVKYPTMANASSRLKIGIIPSGIHPKFNGR